MSEKVCDGSYRLSLNKAFLFARVVFQSDNSSFGAGDSHRGAGRLGHGSFVKFKVKHPTCSFYISLIA